MTDRYQDMRIEKVTAMLDSAPGLRLAVMTEGEAIPDILIMTIAIRGKGAFEVHIPKAKYDAFNLIDAITRHGGGVTE